MTLPFDQPTLESCNSLIVSKVEGENLFATLSGIAFIGVVFLLVLRDFLKQFDKPRENEGF